MKIIFKAKDPDGHTREYARIKGGVTLLNDGSISILTGRWLKDILEDIPGLQSKSKKEML